jgi:hypothetical protein
MPSECVNCTEETYTESLVQSITLGRVSIDCFVACTECSRHLVDSHILLVGVAYIIIFKTKYNQQFIHATFIKS